MYCSIVFYKNKIPVGVTIKKNNDSLIFKIGENEYSIPIDTVSKVLNFFK